MLANGGKLEGIASGMDINGDGGRVKGKLPFGNKALDCIKVDLLRY